jgi:cell division protein ZapB
LEIKDLEAKIDELIQLCDELEQKNTILQTDKNKWAIEKSRLLEKNDLARNKVEAMIMRLKTLEQD